MLNILKMKSNFKHLLIYLCLIFILFALHVISYAKEIQNNISNNILRLHVVANSNSSEDQELKLLVRDNILEYMNEKNFLNLEESKKYIIENICIFDNIAKDTLYKNGYNYPVSVSFEECFFPMKTYENISLPSGKYLALKILIGEAAGQNWWCVMFPPLCFSDSAKDSNIGSFNEILHDNLSTNSYDLITSDVEFRFKIVDLINCIYN